jgi:type VI secretion system protein ImpH
VKGELRPPSASGAAGPARRESPPGLPDAVTQPAWPAGSVAERLFAEPFAFDFFQAVRLLQQLDPGRARVGGSSPPAAEAVRFRAHNSLSFPASAVYNLARPTAAPGPPLLTVTFMGLTGNAGALPRHYTELLLRVEKDARGPEKYALRDWLDLFNHRLVSLFFRGWEKYRFPITYERREKTGVAEPDPFTAALFSLVGLGTPGLRDRLRVAVRTEADGRPRERVLARVHDLALAYYGGLLAHRPRCAAGLEGLLHDYFGLAVRVEQFHGQWLQLDPSNQSRLGDAAGNCALGVNVVAGERVWDVQGKIRLRVGPLRLADFRSFLPDRTPVAQRKQFFALVHLARLYVGPELAFDVQLTLAAAEVPECRLPKGTADGPRLGWDTWVRSQSFARPAEDAVFEGEEIVFVNE